MRIVTASVKTPLEGVVLQATSIANIQKNTLEVKVPIKNPPATIRPEMLVTATFLAPAKSTSNSEQKSASERIMIRKDLVASADGGSFVWVAAFDNTAQRRTVRLGRTGENGFVEVAEGLSPTDKLIVDGRDGLDIGQRIAVSNATAQ